MRSKVKTLSLISGALSALALPPYYVFPLLFVTFSYLVMMLNQANSAKRAFALGYWFGFGFYAVGFSWISNAFMIDVERLGWLIPFALLGSGAFFGLFVAVPGFLSFYFKNRYAKIFAFTSVWVLMEWVRSFVLTGFPWNLLGSVLAFSNETIQLASVVGTYGLSLLVLIVCSLPAVAILSKRYKTITTTALAIMSLVYVFGTWRISRFDNEVSEIKVRVVQPSIPQKMKWDKEILEQNLQTYVDFSTKEGFRDIDLVIWGETANPFILSLEPEYKQKIMAAVPPQGYLITGSLEYTYDQGWYPLNSMLVINKDGIVADYNKSHLVPFGEYIPLRKYLPESLKPVTNVISDFKPGNGVKTISIPGVPPFGGLICYEVIFPAQVVNQEPRPDWLINITNDGWYGTGAGPVQHLVITRLRAVEEGLTIVRVANSGISALISKTGEVLHQIGLNEANTADFYLPSELSTPTIYGKYQNKVPLIICVIFLLISGYFLCNNKILYSK